MHVRLFVIETVALEPANGRFPEIGVVIIHFSGIFHYKPTILVYPHDYGNPPTGLVCLTPTAVRLALALGVLILLLLQRPDVPDTEDGNEGLCSWVFLWVWHRLAERC